MASWSARQAARSFVRPALQFAGLLCVAMVLVLSPARLFSPDSFAAGSPSLQERQRMREQEKRLANEAEFTSKICETRITASIHWQSFNTRGTGLRVVGSCDVALSAIERICREDLSAIKGKVRHMQCGAGDKRRIELNGSTLRYAVGEHPSRSDHEFVYKFLKRKF